MGNKDSTTKECCKDDPSQNVNLVKATELPLHGNPNPPNPATEDKPGTLEVKVRAARLALKPYLAPVCSIYGKTKDVVSIGMAHSQSTIQTLSENQNGLVHWLVIGGSGLLGLTLAKKRGLFKKTIYTTIFMGAAATACFPEQAKLNGFKAWYIAKNKLPQLVKQKYDTLTVNSSKQTSAPESTPKSIE